MSIYDLTKATVICGAGGAVPAAAGLPRVSFPADGPDAGRVRRGVRRGVLPGAAGAAGLTAARLKEMPSAPVPLYWKVSKVMSRPWVVGIDTL